MAMPNDVKVLEAWKSKRLNKIVKLCDQKPCIVKLKYNVHVKNQKIYFIIGRTLVTKIQQEQDD